MPGPRPGLTAGRRKDLDPGARPGRTGPRLRRRVPPCSCPPPLVTHRPTPSPPSDSAGFAPVSRQFIYHMRGLSKSYPGGKKVLENIHLSFYPDAKIGVLGVNGAGKSTLLRIMAGTDTEWSGEAWVADGARVGYLPQEPQLDTTRTVRENVMLGVAPQQAILDRYNEIAMNYSEENADEMTRLQDEIEAKGLWDLDSKVDQAMDALRCPPDDWQVDKLSGGASRRVALCKLLLEQPELLQLDRGRGIPYEGNYSAWLEQKQKRLAQEGREDEAHRRTIEREREWVSASPKARQAKSKARIQRYKELVAKANEKGPTTAQIVIPIAERLGNNVIEFDNLKKAFGDKLLIDGLSFKLPPGGIVGIIGPNGAGKTTLFRMITGQEQPDEGSIKIGESVKLGYVDQSRDSLDANKTLYEEISGGNEVLYLGKREINARAYCGAFNFKGSDQQKKVGVLSGGERNRVHLAKILKSGANV